jgi:3',5'-nucleoside bisphosphate phosphatase
MERLDLIAVTDHNTAKNVRPVVQLGERAGVAVLPGMEVQSREEIHLLALFRDGASIAPWDEEVFRHLPDVKNDPEAFGDQPIVDVEGNILRFEEKLLINSLDYSLEEVKRRVEELGGLVIPSHFDKGSFSLISQLGLIPAGLDLEAVEMTRGRISSVPGLAVPRIVSSDAHSLTDIGSAYTVFLLAEPTLEELRLALRGQAGRRIVERIDRGVSIL